MTASPPASPDPSRGVPVYRSRRCDLPLDDPRATAERLGAYLARVDRPVAALLARDRLERLGPGLFRYRSRPFRLLRFELVPTLQLRARWQQPELEVVSGECRIVGLGRWERSLAFELAATLRPGARCLHGEVRLTLFTAPSLPAWGRDLAGRALDQVLERIERRLRRGLRKDLLTWLWDAPDSG